MLVLDLSRGTPYTETLHITSEGDRLTVRIPQKGSTPMAASKNKTILFGTATDGKTRHLWPIAVFNDVSGAKTFATYLKLAYKSGDDAMIKTLDPEAKRNSEGVALPDTKWSIKTVPYAPAPDVTEDDSAVSEL